MSKVAADSGFWKTRIRVAFEASRPKPPPPEAAVQARPPTKQRRDVGVQTDPLPVRVDVAVQTDPPAQYADSAAQTVLPALCAAGVQTDRRIGHVEAGVEARPTYATSSAQVELAQTYASSEVQANVGSSSRYVSSGVGNDSLVAVDGHDEDDMLISPASRSSSPGPPTSLLFLPSRVPDHTPPWDADNAAARENGWLPTGWGAGFRTPPAWDAAMGRREPEWTPPPSATTPLNMDGSKGAPPRWTGQPQPGQLPTTTSGPSAQPTSSSGSASSAPPPSQDPPPPTEPPPPPPPASRWDIASASTRQRPRLAAASPTSAPSSSSISAVPATASASSSIAATSLAPATVSAAVPNSSTNSTAAPAPAASTSNSSSTPAAAAQDSKAPYMFVDFMPASARKKFKVYAGKNESPGPKYDALVEMWTVQQLDYPLAHTPTTHAAFQALLRAQLAGRDLQLALTAARRWFWAREKKPTLVLWHDKKEAAKEWERRQALAERDLDGDGAKKAKKSKKKPPALAELPKLTLAAATRTLAVRPAHPPLVPGLGGNEVVLKVLRRLDEAERRLLAYGEPFDDKLMLDGHWTPGTAVRGPHTLAQHARMRRAMQVRVWGALRMPGATFAEMEEWAPERMDVEMALWRSMRAVVAQLGGDAPPEARAAAPRIEDPAFFTPASLNATAPGRIVGYPPPGTREYDDMLDQWVYNLLLRAMQPKEDGAPGPPLAETDALATVEAMTGTDFERACEDVGDFVGTEIAPRDAYGRTLIDGSPAIDEWARKALADILTEMLRERVAGFVPRSLRKGEAAPLLRDLGAWFAPRAVPPEDPRYARALGMWARLQACGAEGKPELERMPAWLAATLDASDAQIACEALGLAPPAVATSAAQPPVATAQAPVATAQAPVTTAAQPTPAPPQPTVSLFSKTAPSLGESVDVIDLTSPTATTRSSASDLPAPAAPEAARPGFAPITLKAKSTASTNVLGFVPAASKAGGSSSSSAADKHGAVGSSSATKRSASMSTADGAPSSVPGFVPARSEASRVDKLASEDTARSRSASTVTRPATARARTPEPAKKKQRVFVPASLPGGDRSLDGAEYDRAVEDWVLDLIAREALRFPSGPPVPWPVELDQLLGHDRGLARKVWEEKCASEGQFFEKRPRKRGGRRQRMKRNSMMWSGSGWDTPENDRHWAPPPDAWAPPPSSDPYYDDRDRRLAGPWEDPMERLERRASMGDRGPPPPAFDSYRPAPDDRRGSDNWMSWMPPPEVDLRGRKRKRERERESRSKSRSRSRSASVSRASVDSQFSYSQPVTSAVHTRVPLPDVRKRASRSKSKSKSRSPERSRSRSKSRTRSRLPRRHSRSLSPQEHRARRQRRSSRSSPGHYVPNDPRADHWEPAQSPSDRASPGPALGHYVPNDPRADHWEPSHDREPRADHWDPSTDRARLSERISDLPPPLPPPRPRRQSERGCYVCGEWGHEANRCPNRERAPYLILTSTGKLTLPDGKTTVCWVWNSGAPCTGQAKGKRRKSKGGATTGGMCGHAHACSLCGSEAHPACECTQFRRV